MAETGDSNSKIKREFSKLLEDMERELKEGVREADVATFLEEGLAEMQVLFRSNRHLFDAEIIGFLQNARYFAHRFNQFAEVIEGFEDIVDRADFDEAMEQLTALRQDFKGLKMEQRVGREIRQLQTLLPTLREAAKRKRFMNKNRVIARLNSHAPKCKDGHPMVLREGTPPFWGCSFFPRCWGKRTLSLKELDLYEAGRG